MLGSICAEGDVDLLRTPLRDVDKQLRQFGIAEVRMRLSREPLTEQQAHAFAAVLDSAAQQLERI